MIADLFIYAIFGALGLAIGLLTTYSLWRWIFSIKRQLWNQQQQINLLLKIAEKLGVDPFETATIKYENNNP